MCLVEDSQILLWPIPSDKELVEYIDTPHIGYGNHDPASWSHGFRTFSNHRPSIGQMLDHVGKDQAIERVGFKRQMSRSNLFRRGQPSRCDLDRLLCDIVTVNLPSRFYQFPFGSSGTASK